MKTFTNNTHSARRFVPAIALLALAAPAALGVNILTDPGFESNPLTTAANSLNNFPGFQGVWGQENSTIVGVVGAVSPFQGLRQLQMDTTGGTTTQTFQSVDISAYSGIVDANLAVLNASAYFNVDLPAAVGGIYVSYFTGNSYATIFGPTDLSVFTLDSNPATWQQTGFTVPVPAGTRWLVIQVAYSEASLFSSAGTVGSGYVDSAFAEIRQVPAPGAVALLGLGGLLTMRRRR